MTHEKLVAECKKFNLDTHGTSLELKNRLFDYFRLFTKADFILYQKYLAVYGPV